MVDTCPFPHRSVLPNFDMEGVLGVLSGAALETYVVGRKFGEGVEIISGSSVSLVRDPINAKDPNAIKVSLSLSLTDTHTHTHTQRHPQSVSISV